MTKAWSLYTITHHLAMDLKYKFNYRRLLAVSSAIMKA